MTWYDPKQAAVDPDNPAANEQIPFSEWNAMVAYLKDKIINKTVNAAAIGDNKILVYDLSSDTFVFEAPSAVGTLDDLTDVVISGVPADNEVVAYDSGTSKFTNQTAAEAGIATVAGLAAYLPLAGGVLTGAVTLGGQVNMGGTLVMDDYSITGVMGIQPSGTTITMHAILDLSTHTIIGVVDPTVAQGVSTKNYTDTRLFAKEAVTSFTDGYVPVYRAGSGKFEMEAQAAAGGVLESDFNATTFMYALADNTPLPKTPAEVMAILSGAAGAEFLFGTQKIGGIVDPTTAQQASTKNYADTHLFTKEAVTSFTDGYIPVYRTSSGKFEMEAGGGSAGLPVVDTTAIIKGSGDGTKQVRFEADYLTTGTTRVVTVPDKDLTLCDAAEAVLLDGSQEMTGNLEINKAAPAIKLKISGDTCGHMFYDHVNERMVIESYDYSTLTFKTLRLSALNIDLWNNVIKDPKNGATGTLSGTDRVVEIDIGGTPYYFKVYPTKT